MTTVEALSAKVLGFSDRTEVVRCGMRLSPTEAEALYERRLSWVLCAATNRMRRHTTHSFEATLADR